MASTKKDDKPDEKEEESTLEYRSSSQEQSGGFFTVYKSGQGYWTRMGTAGAALLILGLTSQFLYQQLPAFISPLQQNKTALWIVVAAFFALGTLLIWWLMNKPRHADFLIQTDTEMKKVNWATRKELFGSTRVVILFMFAIAGFLFAVDILAGYFFYFVNILKSPPL